MSKLSGKVAVVTGGSSGIGLAIAQRFVAEGAYVYIVGRREDELERAKAAIGKNVTAVHADVAELADIEALYKQIGSERDSVDIVVASAGIAERVALEAVTEAHFDRTFDINVRGLLFTVQKALPLMKRGGSIVLLSSGAAVKGFPTYTVYAASKAAIRSFARTWAVELKDRGIRVNVLSPGAIETPMLEGQGETKADADEVRAYLKKVTPLGRVGRPDEMAAAALFLASSDSSYTTGADLAADGGSAQV